MMHAFLCIGFFKIQFIFIQSTSYIFIITVWIYYQLPIQDDLHFSFINYTVKNTFAYILSICRQVSLGHTIRSRITRLQNICIFSCIDKIKESPQFIRMKKKIVCGIPSTTFNRALNCFIGFHSAFYQSIFPAQHVTGNGYVSESKHHSPESKSSKYFSYLSSVQCSQAKETRVLNNNQNTQPIKQ